MALAELGQQEKPAMLKQSLTLVILIEFPSFLAHLSKFLDVLIKVIDPIWHAFNPVRLISDVVVLNHFQ